MEITLNESVKKRWPGWRLSPLQRSRSHCARFAEHGATAFKPDSAPSAKIRTAALTTHAQALASLKVGLLSVCSGLYVAWHILPWYPWAICRTASSGSNMQLLSLYAKMILPTVGAHSWKARTSEIDTMVWPGCRSERLMQRLRSKVGMDKRYDAIRTATGQAVVVAPIGHFVEVFPTSVSQINRYHSGNGVCSLPTLQVPANQLERICARGREASCSRRSAFTLNRR